MPSAIIHEKVGYLLGKELNANSYDYYLGLLAPDSPNLNGFAPKEERWPAHVRRKDLNEWREALLKFYLESKNNYPKDFLLGYYIHILTDIVFDDFFYKKIRKEINMQGYSKEDAHQIMSNDMEEYYFNEFDEIKELLKNNQTSYSINNISKELLTSWKDKIINASIKSNKREFVTEEVVENLAHIVYEELLKNNIVN